MEFRQAVEADIGSIMEIILQAQVELKKNGIDQWQNNYPNVETIQNDIDQENAYVLTQNNMVIGTLAVIFDGEETYDVIHDGKWLGNHPYATIHRIATNTTNKGIGTTIIKEVEALCLEKDIHSIRVDTHKDNTAMQKLLHKNKFKYCGIIYLEDYSERMAFEKIIE